MHFLQHLSIFLLILACFRAQDTLTDDQGLDEEASTPALMYINHPTVKSNSTSTTKTTTRTPTTNIFDRFRTKHLAVSTTRSAAELFTRLLKASVSTSTTATTTAAETTEATSTTTTEDTTDADEITTAAATTTTTPATTSTTTPSTQLPQLNITSTTQKSNITSHMHRTNITSTEHHKLHSAHNSKNPSKQSKIDLKLASSGCKNRQLDLSVLLLLLFSYGSIRAYN